MRVESKNRFNFLPNRVPLRPLVRQCQADSLQQEQQPHRPKPRPDDAVASSLSSVGFLCLAWPAQNVKLHKSGRHMLSETQPEGKSSPWEMANSRPAPRLPTQWKLWRMLITFCSFSKRHESRQRTRKTRLWFLTVRSAGWYGYARICIVCPASTKYINVP